MQPMLGPNAFPENESLSRFHAERNPRFGRTVLAAGLVMLAAVASSAQTTKPATKPVAGTAPATESPLAKLPKYSDAQIYQLRTDWPMLKRFLNANTQLPPPTAGEKRVVFVENRWKRHG